MISFDKSADLSGWTDKYIRNPINSWLDRNVRRPVQRGFVQPMQEQFIPGMQQIVGESKESIRNAANPLTIPGHIKSEFGKGYQGFYKPEMLDKLDPLRATGMFAGGVASEFGKGYTGFYKPETLDKLNPLRATGMLAAGVEDRWNHDYSTNADGTPNTNAPTFWSTAADTGRNLVRNLSFASDMPGTTRLPWFGETKNSTLANMSALPANALMWSDMLLPKSWSGKIIPKIGGKKPVPIANMSEADKFRLYKKIEHEKAKLYRDFMSTRPLHEEFEAIPKDPRNPMTFNQYLNKRRPERWAEYVAKNKELSEKQGLIYPWLNNDGKFVYRTGTGTHLTSSGNHDIFGARLDFQAPMWKDPDAIIWRDISRYGHMFPRFLMRMHRDGHWNTGKEQAKSFASDATGDYMSNMLTWGGSETLLPAIGDWIHPAIGAGLRRAAPSIRNAANIYLMYANQRDAFQNAMGKAPEEYLHLPNFRSYFSKKLHDAANSIPTLNDVMNTINTLPSPDDAENRGVYVPGRVNSTVQ